MNRKPLDFSSLAAMIKEMSEDSSAAASVIDELIQTKGENITFSLLIILDDLNIRGTQIQNLYKMCGQNIEKFYEKIISIEKKDIEKLNSISFSINKYKAVFEGTSKDRLLTPEKYIFTDEERNKLRNKKSKDMAKDILDDRPIKKELDLYPSINSKDALEIIEKYGFTCGYKKTYENQNKQKIIYRVFYNEFNDILYTHSLENPDIFLWGKSKLNIIRQPNHKDYKDINCNIYSNAKGVVSYNIDLKEKPFTEYQKILNRKEEPIKEITPEYYDSTLIPVIESVKAINYKEKKHDYKGIAVSNIYNLLTFPENYYDLDENLKKIYKPLLNYSETKAYDEIIYELNAEDGIEIAKKIQDALGINLDKRKLMKAKDNYQKKLHQKFDNFQTKFLNHFIEVPENKDMNEKINKIIDKNNVPNF